MVRLILLALLAATAACSRQTVVAPGAPDAFDAGVDGALDAEPDATPDDVTPPPELLRTTPPSPGSTNRPAIFGTSVLGAEVAVFVDAACGGVPVAELTSGGSFEVRLDLGPGTHAITAEATRPPLATSPCSEVLTYVRAAPATPRALTTDPASPALAAEITLAGQADPDVRVEVYAGESCDTRLGETLADPDGAFSLVLGVAAGDTALTARAFDAEGVASACSAPLVFTRTRVGPVGTLFPPAPGVTELESLTLRARFDAAADAVVVFAGPAGAVDARYDPVRDEWSAMLPLVPGVQMLSATVDGVAQDLMEVQRVELPPGGFALAWDDARGELVFSFGSRLYAHDPTTRTTELRVDLEADDVAAVFRIAVDGPTTYVLGRLGSDGRTAVMAWDGRTVREVTRFAIPREGPSGLGLSVRDGGAELILHAFDGVLLVDASTGDVRRNTFSPFIAGRALAYDPVEDQVIFMTRREYWRFDPTTRALLSFAYRGDETPPGPPDEMVWDARSGRVVLRDLDGFYGFDPETGEVERLAGRFRDVAPQQLALRRDTGQVLMTLGITEPLSLATLAPVTGATGRHSLLRAGTGAPLGTPGLLTWAGERLVASADGDLLELTLGPAGGERRVLRAGSGPDVWVSAIVPPGTDALHGTDGAGALRTGSLASGTRVVVPGPFLSDAGLARAPWDVALRPGVAGSPSELLTILGGGAVVRARELDALTRARVAVTSERNTVAVGYDPVRREIGTLGSEVVPSTDPDDPPGWRLVLEVVPEGDAPPRELASWDIGPVAQSFRFGLAWSEGEWFVAPLGRISVVDAATGAVRADRPLFSQTVEVREIAPPGPARVAYATLHDTYLGTATAPMNAIAAVDAETLDWVILARE